MQNNSFTACILVGGKASRLGAITSTLPKCLLPIYGVPFLQLLINKLQIEGCTRIILAAGHLSDAIVQFVNEHLKSTQIDIVFETGGTGKAISAAFSIVSENGDILCLNGDTLVDVRYDKIINAHRRTEAIATILTTDLDNLQSGGALQIDGNERVRNFVELETLTQQVSPLPAYRLAGNGGCYCFKISETKKFLANCEGKSLEHDILPKLVREAVVQSVHCNNKNFLDFGTPERLNGLPLKFSSSEISRIFHTHNL